MCLEVVASCDCCSLEDWWPWRDLRRSHKTRNAKIARSSSSFCEEECPPALVICSPFFFTGKREYSWCVCGVLSDGCVRESEKQKKILRQRRQTMGGASSDSCARRYERAIPRVLQPSPPPPPPPPPSPAAVVSSEILPLVGEETTGKTTTTTTTTTTTFFFLYSIRFQNFQAGTDPLHHLASDFLMLTPQLLDAEAATMQVKLQLPAWASVQAHMQACGQISLDHSQVLWFSNSLPFSLLSLSSSFCVSTFGGPNKFWAPKSHPEYYYYCTESLLQLCQSLLFVFHFWRISSSKVDFRSLRIAHNSTGQILYYSCRVEKEIPLCSFFVSWYLIFLYSQMNFLFFYKIFFVWSCEDFFRYCFFVPVLLLLLCFARNFSIQEFVDVFGCVGVCPKKTGAKNEEVLCMALPLGSWKMLYIAFHCEGEQRWPKTLLHPAIAARRKQCIINSSNNHNNNSRCDHWLVCSRYGTDFQSCLSTKSRVFWWVFWAHESQFSRWQQ